MTECSSGPAPSEVDSGGTSAEPQLDPVSISENFTVDPDPESEKENKLRILREQMVEIQEEKENPGKELKQLEEQTFREVAGAEMSSSSPSTGDGCQDQHSMNGPK